MSHGPSRTLMSAHPGSTLHPQPIGCSFLSVSAGFYPLLLKTVFRSWWRRWPAPLPPLPSLGIKKSQERTPRAGNVNQRKVLGNLAQPTNKLLSSTSQTYSQFYFERRKKTFRKISHLEHIIQVRIKTKRKEWCLSNYIKSSI